MISSNFDANKIVMNKILIWLFFLAFWTGTSAQKRVLVEKFTNAYCGACPNGTIILEGFQEEYPSIILVKHHKTVSWSDNPLPNPASAVLRSDVRVWGQPTAMVDRKADGDEMVFSSSRWEDKIKGQLDAPHFVNLNFLQGSFDESTRSLEFEIEMNFDELPAAQDLRLSVLVVEDAVWGVEQHNYSNDVPGHPLEGKGDIIWAYEHNDVTRMILDEPWGTAAAFPDQLETGTPYLQSYSYTVPEDYAIRNMKVVAVVAQHDEADVYNRTVLNANEFLLKDELDLLSSAESISKTTFSITPNPAQDKINLVFDALPQALLLFDSNGQKISEIAKPSQKMNLNVSELKAGSYIIMVETLQGQLIAKRFSKI